MQIDAFTIAALTDEFMDAIVGGRVQNSVVVDATGIGLEVYAKRKRQYLYLSADKNAPRVHLVGTKLRRGMPKPTQLALLVRRYVEKGHITHVSQPPHERILHIDVTGSEGDVTLIVEPMPRRSNVILVQGETVLDCARRVGPEDNRYRVTLPAQPYVAPPPLTGRLDPATITREQIYGIFDQNQDEDKEVRRLLGARLLGFSTMMGCEVVFQAAGDDKLVAKDADIDAIYEVLVGFMGPLARREWQPGVVEQGGEVEGFTIFPVTYMDGWRPVETVSEALTAYFGAPSGPDGYKIAKKPVREAVREAKIREGNKLKSLRGSLTDESEREKLRQSGELILAYQYMLEAGQGELVAQYDPNADPLKIRLDPQLDALENAQRYFKKYDKAKRALADVPQLVEETENRLSYLEQLQTDIDLAGNWVEIDEVRQELREMGYWQGQAPKKIGGSGKTGPMRLLLGDGFVTWVGRNSRQNDMATFGKGGGDDLWLHARDVPGAHVVIKFDGRTIPEDVIEQAAAMAAYYSKLRGEGNVVVDVTQCKHVRKIKGAAPGMVTYKNEMTRTVVPQNEDDLGLV
jgi:predicted ribosome quality control (RQC) complex YloA/Tae2 family protein